MANEMDKAKFKIIKTDLTTYILTICDFDLSEYVYQLSNAEEFKHHVETYPHTNTLTIKPRMVMKPLPQDMVIYWYGMMYLLVLFLVLN